MMPTSDLKKIKQMPFDFQTWPIYKRTLDLTLDLLQISKDLNATQHGYLANQLNRAASSILLNLAEGSARFSLKEKMHFWRISKGSLFECVAIFDLSKKLITITEQSEEKTTGDMSEIGKMLSGLIRWANKEKGKLPPL